jgi:hypothetical protein
MMPTQRPTVSESPPLRLVAPAEEVIQFSLSLRRDRHLNDQLAGAETRASEESAKTAQAITALEGLALAGPRAKGDEIGA